MKLIMNVLILLVLSIMANIFIRTMYNDFDGLSYVWGYTIGNLLMAYWLIVNDM